MNNNGGMRPSCLTVACTSLILINCVLTISFGLESLYAVLTPYKMTSPTSIRFKTSKRISRLPRTNALSRLIWSMATWSMPQSHISNALCAIGAVRWS